MRISRPDIGFILASLNRKLRHQDYPIFYLPLCSGLLLGLAWPPNHMAPLLFVAIVPLLQMGRYIEERRYKCPYWITYKYTYLTCFLWNLITTWWVARVTIAGALFMLFVNTCYMSLPLLLAQWTTRQYGRYVGYVALLAYWLSMEYIHLQWEFSFPWLNLGNGLACYPKWIQWYEYTGVLGGTVWILIANILLDHLLTLKRKNQRWRLRGLISCWILIPIACSLYRYYTYHEQGEPVEVVVIQPNVDPHTGVFLETGEVLTTIERLGHFFKLSEMQLTPKTQFLVWPEVAINDLCNEQKLKQHVITQCFIAFAEKYPQLSLVTGIASLVNYGRRKATRTARSSDRHGYYDVFNTALFLGSHGGISTYHKSRLVPGVELIPYLYSIKVPQILVPKGYSNSLGSLGRQSNPSVFSNESSTCIAPIICYESIYGDYVAQFVRMGAALVFTLSVDGWWGKTPGYQQHFHYTRLRAIECRRSIARSALKGMSAFINQRGDILEATHYEKQVAMKHTLQANSTLTFYVQHGELIARTALWTALLLLLGSAFKVIIKRYLRRGGTRA